MVINEEPRMMDSDSLEEAVCFITGSYFVLRAPDLGEPRHALALLQLEYNVGQIQADESIE